MYRIWYSNFGYFSSDSWDNFDDAVRHAQKGSFQSSIYKGNELVASWCPIKGLRKWGL